MPLFSGRTPEDRMEEAAFKAAWKVLEPVEGLALDQPALDRAWGAALPAAKSANKGKARLNDDLMRHHANRGFRQAWTLWDERVAELRATKRRVIVETAHDGAAAMMAGIGSVEEVQASVERAYYSAAPQAQWLNDGMFALGEQDFARAVYEGAQRAADDRIADLTAQPRALGGGPRSSQAQRAFDLAADAARYSAVGALAAHSEIDAEAGEAVAMDAAAAAVEALPDDILKALDDEDVLNATVRGADEALGEHSRESAPTRPPASDTGAAAAARRAAASAGGFYAGATSRVKPAAGKAAETARTTGYRIAIARKVKRAVDAKLPEADGYGLAEPESARAYEAARLAARAANEDLGGPFAEEDVERLAKMTSAGIIATWHAVGHLKRSGATEAMQGAARDTALRYLRTTPLPASLVEYLLDEAIRVATPGWAQPGGDERWADKAAQARRRMQPTTFRGRSVPNYYELLQVSPKADTVVIEKAWRALIATAHPDQGGDPERARQLNEAREVLLDPVTRRRFDEENGF